MKLLNFTYFTLISAKSLTEVFSSSDKKCVAIDPRVDDAWCESNGNCSYCPECGTGATAGFCEWYDPNATTTTAGPPTTRDPNASTQPPITPPEDNLCGSPWLMNVIYLDYQIDWSHLENDIRACIDACFNVIMLSFYMGTNGSKPVDALLTWQQMTPAARQEISDYAHSKGAVIMMALGGATDHIEPLVENHQGAEYARPACQFVLDYNLDGIDFDIELEPQNSGPFKDHSMQSFIYDGSMECRRTFGNSKLISHAPQAPYMGDWAGSDYGYTQVFKYYPDLIDFLNIQFYNQGSDVYSTYENTYVKGDGWTSNSAIFEMIDNGIPAEKLVHGRPVGPAGYANSGYVDPNTLHEWGCRAYRERGITAGFMTWMYGKGKSDYVTWGQAITAEC